MEHPERSREARVQFVQDLEQEPIVHTASLIRHRRFTEASREPSFDELHIDWIDAVLVNDFFGHRAEDRVVVVLEEWASRCTTECVTSEGIVGVPAVLEDGALCVRSSPIKYTTWKLQLLDCWYVLSVHVWCLRESRRKRLNVGPDASQGGSVRIWRAFSSLAVSGILCLQRNSRPNLSERRVWIRRLGNALVHVRVGQGFVDACHSEQLTKSAILDLELSKGISLQVSFTEGSVAFG